MFVHTCAHSNYYSECSRIYYLYVTANTCLYTLVPIVTIGHETVMGKTLFFGSRSPPKEEFDFETEYPFMEELLDNKLKVRTYSITI